MSTLGWSVTLVALVLVSIRRPVPTRDHGLPVPGHPGRRTTAAGRTVAHAARLVWEQASGRNVDRRDEQLCGALDHVAASLRGGSSLVTAISSAAETIDDPIGVELRQATSTVRSGAPLREALGQWSKRSSAHSGTQLAATALVLAADAGGEVARSVDRVAATLRERREVRAEARALATQARASAAVLTVAPVLFTVLVAAVEPDVVAFLVGTPAGIVCLVIGLTLDAVGALWMTKIVRSAA